MRTTVVALALGLITLGAASCGGSGNAGGATQVAITVTGSAPKGASITYGSDSTTYTGHFPLHKTLPLGTRVGYYFVSAQLEDGGAVTCTLTIGSASSVGHAHGGHRACTAKLTNNYQGGWR